VWDWLREPNSNRNLRAHALGGATQKPDGKRPAALRKLSTRNTTGARHGSCRRAIRPARDTEAVGAQYDRRATRKLSTRNTTGARHGSCRRTIRPARYTEAVGAQYDRRSQREPRHARQHYRWSQQKPRHARQRYRKTICTQPKAFCQRAEQPALLTQPIASCERTRQPALLTRPKALWSKRAANSAYAAGALLKRPAALNTAGAL
jgi:hypothetical protein